MRRPLRNAAATVIGVAVTVTAMALVSRASATSSVRVADRDDTSHVLHLDVRFRPFADNYVDIGARGPSIGDPIVFDDRLLNHSGRVVGTEAGTCTVTTVLADGFRTHCVGTARLPGGQIAFQGLVSNAPVKRLAVVGGTGRYRNAAGTLVLTELGHDEAGTLTIRLLR